jgi:hypothetical protein
MEQSIHEGRRRLSRCHCRTQAAGRRRIKPAGESPAPLPGSLGRPDPKFSEERATDMGEEGSEEHCGPGAHLEEKRDGRVSERKAIRTQSSIFIPYTS